MARKGQQMYRKQLITLLSYSGTRREQEVTPDYKNLKAYPLLPTSSTEAPPFKHATVFPDTTSRRSNVQIHEPMGDISHPNHHNYKISNLARGVNVSSTQTWLSHLCACLFNFVAFMLHKDEGAIYIRSLVKIFSRLQSSASPLPHLFQCHTKAIYPSSAFFRQVGGTGSSPALSRCSHTSHVPVSIICVIFRSKTVPQTRTASHSMQSIHSTQITSLLAQQIRNNQEEDNTATVLFHLP